MPITFIETVENQLFFDSRHCKVRQLKKVVTFEIRGGACISFTRKIPRHKIQSYTYNPTRVAISFNARDKFVNCA